MDAEVHGGGVEPVRGGPDFSGVEGPGFSVSGPV